MEFTDKKLLSVLKKHHYKLTPQRRAVIQVITSSQDHLTPGAIHQKVHQDYPNIGFVTVYRTLDMLAELGLICELHAGRSCHSYTLSVPEHHHHLICSNCGKVTDFTGFELSELEQKLSRETGFAIEGHLLEFIGLCQTCRREQ